MLLSKVRESRQSFDAFVKQGVPERIAKIYQRKRLPAILGTEDFIRRISERYVRTKLDDYELPEAKRIGRLDMGEIARIIADEYKVSVENLRQGKRRVKNQPRRLAIHIARQFAGYSLREIGEFFV